MRAVLAALAALAIVIIAGTPSSASSKPPKPAVAVATVTGAGQALSLGVYGCEAVAYTFTVDSTTGVFTLAAPGGTGDACAGILTATIDCLTTVGNDAKLTARISAETGVFVIYGGTYDIAFEAIDGSPDLVRDSRAEYQCDVAALPDGPFAAVTNGDVRVG
jgi:hypothetical protein